MGIPLTVGILSTLGIPLTLIFRLIDNTTNNGHTIIYSMNVKALFFVTRTKEIKKGVMRGQKWSNHEYLLPAEGIERYIS